jgi:hypothetical protein
VPRTSNPPDAGDADAAARRPAVFAGRFGNSFAALRRVVALALLAGIALTPNLWFPAARTFPRAPLLDALPRGLVLPFEYLLGGLLVAALAALLFAKRPTRYLHAAIISLALLALSDQMRLQPWVYQYLLIFVVIALRERHGAGVRSDAHSLRALRLIVAALYFWGGVQKLNYSFGREVLPQLLAPLQSLLTFDGAQLSALGAVLACVEVFTGCGLLFGRTRKFCVWLALAMHLLVLGLLVGRGYNSAVWVGNVALMPTVDILFRRGDARGVRAPAGRPARDGSARAAQVIAVACAALPALSFWGWWDMYLSGALYSGNTAVAVVRVDGRVYERLPEAAKRQVFETKGGELMLPVFEWSMADLNVPPYPEPRVFERVARDVCGLAEGGGSRAELITKGRPAASDGSHAVTRTDCSQLDE